MDFPRAIYPDYSGESNCTAGTSPAIQEQKQEEEEKEKEEEEEKEKDEEDNNNRDGNGNGIDPISPRLNASPEKDVK